MNVDLIREAHEAHVAVHGPDCGRGPNGHPPKTACRAVYIAWLHFADGSYRVRNKSVIGSRSAARREAHPDRERAYQATYRAAHREELARRARAKDAIYRAAHREELAAKNAAYQAAHRDELKAYRAAYHASRRDEVNARRRAEYAARKNTTHEVAS